MEDEEPAGGPTGDHTLALRGCEKSKGSGILKHGRLVLLRNWRLEGEQSIAKEAAATFSSSECIAWNFIHDPVTDLLSHQAMRRSLYL